MTTLATGLPISNKSSDTKITPGLRLAVQKATSVFQKDYCYDFLQALVDEPEIADPVGVRVFLNFCLKKPDTLIDSFLDSIDQNISTSQHLSDSAETVLSEVEDFIDFIHGLIDMIDSGEIFKLAYHEIDAWNLSYKLLEPIQRRLFDLAVQDRHQLNSNQDSNSNDQIELSYAANSTNSGFYQAFVSIDKFLKHSFESRALLEPAKLVEEVNHLNERKTELQTFRTMFPTIQSSTILIKKHGRFGREEAAIDQFMESEKFKELSKLKSTMSGGQLTRQPSTRTKKIIKQSSTPNQKDIVNVTESTSKTKRSTSIQSTAPANDDLDSTHIDPFLQEEPSPPGKLAFADDAKSTSDSDAAETIKSRRKSHQPESVTSSLKKQSATRTSLPNSANSKRKRSKLASQVEKDTSSNSSKRKRPKRKKSTGKKTKSGDEGEEEEEEELFVIEKIIGESVDINGEVIYKVLWAGYPESEATWQFANTLDDCAAVDVWQSQKRNGDAKKNENGKVTTTQKPKKSIPLSEDEEEDEKKQKKSVQKDSIYEDDIPVPSHSPAALADRDEDDDIVIL